MHSRSYYMIDRSNIDFRVEHPLGISGIRPKVLLDFITALHNLVRSFCEIVEILLFTPFVVHPGDQITDIANGANRTGGVWSTLVWKLSKARYIYSPNERFPLFRQLSDALGMGNRRIFSELLAGEGARERKNELRKLIYQCQLRKDMGSINFSSPGKANGFSLSRFVRYAQRIARRPERGDCREHRSDRRSPGGNVADLPIPKSRIYAHACPPVPCSR